MFSFFFMFIFGKTLFFLHFGFCFCMINIFGQFILLALSDQFLYVIKPFNFGSFFFLSPFWLFWFLLFFYLSLYFWIFLRTHFRFFILIFFLIPFPPFQFYFVHYHVQLYFFCLFCEYIYFFVRMNFFSLYNVIKFAWLFVIPIYGGHCTSGRLNMYWGLE